jgi:hypothetical protein
MGAPRFRIRSLEAFERDVRLRMPFRFGIVTLTRAPQAFVRARIALADGREAEGAAAELLAPKWFDKDPRLTNEENVEQLRAAVALAREAYLASGPNTASGHWSANHEALAARGAERGLNRLTTAFGPALIDRAVLDALCRALGVSFYEAIRADLAGLASLNVAAGPRSAGPAREAGGSPAASAVGPPVGPSAGVSAPGIPADLAGFDLRGFLADLRPAAKIAARHTVGLVDPITAGDVAEPVGDGLPETLEEVVARYGHRWFKLKVAGDPRADVERLAAIAAVIDRIPDPYRATLDGNEQYEDVLGALELWRRIEEEPRLARLAASVVFIEQPVKRASALASDVSPLAARKPVIIDESDDSLDAFPLARRLGYTGVSSKTCKGLYKSILNLARCCCWNRDEGADRYFMSGEDLTIQPGLGLQQDLALVSLLGIRHVERNGHHYVNGMAGLPEVEQAAFLAAHPDLYERSHGAVRLRITGGMLAIGSLDCAGFASRAMPDWSAMKGAR